MSRKAAREVKPPRVATCVLPEGGVITVQLAEGGRAFVGGDVVDLDEVCVPAAGETPAQTWADALGAHVEESFVITAPADPAPALPVE